MRIVVLSLVIANLGFLAWTHWVKPAPRPVQDYSGPGIVLLRELPAESALRSLTEKAPGSEAALPNSDTAGQPSAGGAALGLAVEAAAADVVQRCLAVGPFTDPERADGVGELVAAAGIDANRFVGVEDVRDGYWVYIEQIADRTEAQSMLAELADGGVDDTLLIANSERGILISLGVFSGLTGAGAMAERVGALGFETTIAENFHEAEVVWLQMTIASDVDVLGLLQETGLGDGLVARDCAAAND